MYYPEMHCWETSPPCCLRVHELYPVDHMYSRILCSWTNASCIMVTVGHCSLTGLVKINKLCCEFLTLPVLWPRAVICVYMWVQASGTESPVCLGIVICICFLEHHVNEHQKKGGYNKDVAELYGSSALDYQTEQNTASRAYIRFFLQQVTYWNGKYI